MNLYLIFNYTFIHYVYHRVNGIGIYLCYHRFDVWLYNVSIVIYARNSPTQSNRYPQDLSLLLLNTQKQKIEDELWIYIAI